MKYAFEQTAIGIAHVSLSGIWLRVNQHLCDIVGYTKEELLTKSFMDLTPPEEVRQDMEAGRRLLADEIKIYHREKQYIGKQGARIWVDMTTSLFRNPSGSPEYFITFIKNITDRKMAEQRFQILFEQAADCILVLEVMPDHTVVIRDVNAAVVRALGYERNELLGHSMTFLEPPSTGTSVSEERRQIILSPANCVFQVQHRRRDGVIREFECAVTEMTIGSKTLAISIERDITDRKRFEDERLKADKLDSLGILAGGIAHDFNNLLTGIMGNISMVRREVELEGESVGMMEEALEAARQAKALSLQLLTFAKGGLPIKKLTALADIIRDSALFAVRGSKIRCECRINEDLSPAEVDPGQIGQVVNNMVINAKQAMPKGGTITVRAENISLPEGALPVDAGRYVRIAISDTGIGIPADNLTYIFDPYFTTKQTGTGLGLATCYSIIKRHHGHIHVQSELGKGTTFSIYLPASMGAPASLEKPGDGEIVKGQGRILVMDDEPLVCSLLKNVLSELGYTMEITHNGDMAIERYRETWGTNRAFDAVILDLTVPGGKGGLETIGELLKINPKAKVVVSSGYSDDAVMANCKEHGFSAVLSKPYEVQELSQVLHKIILIQQMTSPKPLNRKLSPNRLLFILTGLNLLNYMDRYVINAVRSPLALDLGIGYGDSGRLFTAFMLGYFVTSPFFGVLGDRVSRKWLIALGISIWSLGTVLSGFAAGFASLLFFRVMVGTGEAAYATLSPAMISDEWGPARRNNALTIFYAAIPLGSAIGYLFGGEVAARWGWRSAFLWAGLPGFVLAMVLLPFQEPRRGESDGAALSPRPRLIEVLRLFRNADYNLVVWGYVAYTFALGAFAFWGPTFLEKVHHLSTVRADRFFGGVITVGGLAGTLLGGFAATAWRRRNPAAYAWVMSGSMFLAGPLSLAALGTSRPALCMSLLAVAIFLLFLSTGPVNTLILETVPVPLRASAMAISIFLIHLFGDMWSPEIVGRLADRLGGDLQKSVLILPAAVLVAGFIWLALALKSSTSRSPDPPFEDSRSG